MNNLYKHNFVDKKEYTKIKNLIKPYMSLADYDELSEEEKYLCDDMIDAGIIIDADFEKDLPKMNLQSPVTTYHVSLVIGSLTAIVIGMILVVDVMQYLNHVHILTVVTWNIFAAMLLYFTYLYETRN